MSLISSLFGRARAASLTLCLLLSAGLAACATAAYQPAPATPARHTATPLAPATTAAPAPVIQQGATPSPAATALAPTPTPTPTARPVIQPTLGFYNITPYAEATLVTPFPTPIPTLTLDSGVINILLAGSDSRPQIEKNFRTDTLIIVSINTATGAASLISIPRDLFVYVPTWGMTRINTAYDAGERIHYPGGGPALLEQTILYNLGLPIHYYATINFAGFRQVVDSLGGIDVAVNCPVTEYKLKSPELDETNVDNYALYQQPIGLTHMTGDLALWYARARPVGGDFFRSYRQRQVLRAIYRTALATDVIPHLPSLYGNFRDLVQTNMSVWDLMQFAPLAGHLDDAQVRSFAIGPNQTTAWVTPRGEDVLLPNPEPLMALLAEAFKKPAANQPKPPAIRVEVVNASGTPDLDQLAAETLRNEGFVPHIGPAAAVEPITKLFDLTTPVSDAVHAKQLQTVLHLADKYVLVQPEAAARGGAQFRAVLGQDYIPCPRLDWIATPTPAPTP